MFRRFRHVPGVGVSMHEMVTHRKRAALLRGQARGQNGLLDFGDGGEGIEMQFSVDCLSIALAG